jgi:hypothetical protein
MSHAFRFNGGRAFWLVVAPAPRGQPASCCPLTIIGFVFDTYQMFSLSGEQKYEATATG